MAAPAPRRAPAVAPRRAEAPVRTLEAERTLALSRARHRAQAEHQLELRRARLRFWALIATLLLVGLFLSLTIREQIQTLFGL
jgi:hypothetical protein